MPNRIAATPTTRPVNLPPVECAPWCTDGSGHTDAEHPADQYCSAPSQRVTLIREDPVPGDGDHQGSTLLDYLSVHLYHDRFDAEPHLELNRNDMSCAQLTPSEALELARVLTVLAGAARV